MVKVRAAVWFVPSFGVPTLLFVASLTSFLHPQLQFEEVRMEEKLCSVTKTLEYLSMTDGIQQLT